MKKIELPKMIDKKLIDAIFGFCFARTNSSYEAEELCSDILFALIKSAAREGELEEPTAFIWRVARNVYADYAAGRRKSRSMRADEDISLLSDTLPEEEDGAENDTYTLAKIYREIAFLTKKYRETMILYYLDGVSIKDIAAREGIGESAVRQRLFAARQIVKSEVTKMEKTYSKPTSLEKMNFGITGTGSPATGDPRTCLQRQLSYHILWLCRDRALTAKEISEELNVPTMYIEEELEIQVRGEGGYGALRKTENGKYTANFILLTAKQAQEARSIYEEFIPDFTDAVEAYFDEHKAEYMSYPYLNKKIDENLVFWQQIQNLAYAFWGRTRAELEKHLDVQKRQRPFFVYGERYENAVCDGGSSYGCDGINASNILGYSSVYFENMYDYKKMKPHFHCGHNISTDALLQMAIRAIDGIDVNSLSEKEKECAARAIKKGYILREGDMLYTKILMCADKDYRDISNRFVYDSPKLSRAVEKMAAFIKKNIPEYLIPEYDLVNSIAAEPTFGRTIETLIERGILTLPEGERGAEGCYGILKK